MPTEQELLALTIKWIERAPNETTADAYDKAALIDAIKAKIAPDRTRAFLLRLLDPEDLGHAVSHEVRQKVRELL